MASKSPFWLQTRTSKLASFAVLLTARHSAISFPWFAPLKIDIDELIDNAN
ncbi:MAG: hypothetical protein HY847_00160 [Betaproteobacteria bacterium]|nr:hypothetical protein [Betaproteobacteria bacterium]